MMGGSPYPRSKVDLGGGRGWLTKEAAASIFRIDRALGHRMQITEAGRSFFTQEQHYKKYLRDGWPIALNPNTPSVHQIGDAIDTDEGQKHVALLAEHGWIRTVYRWVNGVWTLVERWHFEHFIEKDKHRFDPAPSSGGGSKVEEEEEWNMSQIRYVHRVEKGYDTEWMIAGMEIPGGFMTTSDESVARGWGAMYGTEKGDSWKALSRKDYMRLQTTMRDLNARWVAQMRAIHGTK